MKIYYLNNKFIRANIENIPIYLSYVAIPLISFFCIYNKIAQPNYEIFWLILLIFIIINAKFLTYKLYYFKLYVIILIITFIKYILPFFWHDNVSIKALSIDYKWIFYFLYSLLWIDNFGKVKFITIYNCGLFLSILYSLYVICRILSDGIFSRSQSHMFDEGNYICFLILLAFCLKENVSLSHKLIFLLATILSYSRTGIIAYLILLFYPYYYKSKNKFKYWIALPFVIYFYIFIFFVYREDLSLNQIDRIIFYRQYIECIRDFNWQDIIFGVFPGIPIQIESHIEGFDWHIMIFEKMHQIVGCYPFNFHSTYIRLILVWGIPLFTLVLTYVFKYFRNTKNMCLRKFILLILIESISLSTLSLTSISIIVFLIILSFNNRQKYENFNS